MKPLRVALIGYGLAGSVFHAPLVAATPGLRLASVVTSDRGRREQVRRDHPDVAVIGGPDELWQRAGEHDIVVIAAPNSAHVRLSRETLDTGLAVVVDKPLAATAAEARALVEDARAAGRFLTVFQNRRWDSDHLTLGRLLSAGVLGEVLRYESRFERWRPDLRPGAWREAEPPAAGGGVLLDLGSHLVDQAVSLFGPPVDVHAEIDSRRGGPADDDAFLALRHRSGAVSHLWMSAVAAAPGPRLRVLGSRAAFVVDEVDGQEGALRAGGRPGGPSEWGVEPEERWGRLVAGERVEPVPSEPGAWPRFYAELERALRAGGPPPVDPVDAVGVLEVLDRAREVAAARGR